MANELDREVYAGGNNAHTTCRPKRWQTNSTTGLDELVPLSGLTDLKAFLSASATAADEAGAFDPALVVTMAEAGSTAAYQATFSGATMATKITAPDQTEIFRHWQSKSAGYHEVAPVLWRTARTAES